MDFSATQVYDENVPFTQVLHEPEEEEPVQVGTLNIDSVEYPIKTGTTIIGRHSICDIVIKNATISKQHAEIEASLGSTWISDLNSSNKTKLNNCILRAKRLYELKDKNVIEFGGVHAVYHTYCSTSNIVVPETPAPPQQTVASTIIPNTPDSFLTNSSSVDNDGSIIFGTQKDDENNIFRQPQMLHCQSTNSSLKNISTSESNDSQTSIAHASILLNGNKDQQVNICDIKTQKFKKECDKVVLKSIHDLEVQKNLKDIPKHLIEKDAKETSVKQTKTSKCVTDIHDIETQRFINDIDKTDTQKNEIDNSSGVTEKFTMNIHTMEMQKYNKSENSKVNANKSKIDKNNDGEKNVVENACNIHDVETQRFDNNSIAKDISDLETQVELRSIARSEQSRDISDMETQFVVNQIVDSTSNKISNNQVKNSITDITKDGMSLNTITKPPESSSSSPRYLNLSSPEIEDCPSPLNQSSHLLETSYLLEFFGEGIDKQEKIQSSNTSTPKPLIKVPLDSKNAEDNEEDDDEDIFEAPTQCNSNFEALMSDDSKTRSEKDTFAVGKILKKCEKSQPEQTNDDSETDAEEYVEQLAKNQHESSRLQVTLNESNKDTSKKNDPGTSAESEDMFNLPTQKLDSSVTKNTSDSINQPQKPDEINKTVDNMKSMQITNGVDQDNRTNALDINTMATQFISSQEFFRKAVINQSGTTTTHINRQLADCCSKENLDCENVDYELAPTQLFDETDKKKQNSICEKDLSQVNVNDILEEKLNDMFDIVNNDPNKIPDLPHMSTQCLQDILESQDDDINKSDTDDKNIDTTSRRQLKKIKSNLLNTETNVNNVNETKDDSQDSDVHFSVITTRRKKNIIQDTKDSLPINSLPISKVDKKNNVSDGTAVEFNNKRKKKMAETKNKSDTIMKTLTTNKNKLISSGCNERNPKSSKLMKQKEAIPETNKQVFGRDSVKVDAAEEKMSCMPCPSTDGQRVQTLNTLYEIGDDILAHLPAVRISGTISNPPSPSASSTSTVCSTSKRSTAKTKETKSTPLKKELCKWDIGNLKKNDKLSVVSCSNSVISSPTTVKTSKFVFTSEDSETDSETDNEIKYKRFQQIANRILGNKFDYVKQQDIKSRQIKSGSPDLLKDLTSNTDIESKSHKFIRTSLRLTQHSSRQIDKNSHDSQRKTRMKNTAVKDNVEKSETKFTIVKKKISLNIVKESVEPVISKRRKIVEVPEESSISTRSRRNTMKTATDRQSSNTLEYFTKSSSSETSPIIERTKFSKDSKTVIKTGLRKTQKTPLLNMDANIDSEKSNIEQTKRIIYDNQVMTHNDTNGSGDSKKTNSAQIKEMQMIQLQNKILKVVLDPIKGPSSDNESQEVERIMAKCPSNAQDKNLSIREGTKAKLFQKELRLRSRKRSYSDTETDSVLTESISSEIEDSDDIHINNLALRAKRGKLAKSTISSLTEAQVSKKKETFKKPIRAKNTSTNTSLDSFVESSQSSTENLVPTNSRNLRSKVSNIRKQKAESNQNTEKLIDKTALKLHVNIKDMSLVSTPYRTRRSTSTSSSSTPTAIKYQILFTGITEDYSKIVTTLGGRKVEDPAKCTILVTDKVRRTYKFLCALARGIPIVAIDWLKNSEAAAQFLNWENYILKDPAAEAKFGFRLRKSLDRAKEKQMLDGFTVILTPNIAPPPIEELKDMVLSCGGKALLRAPTKWPEKAVILSREEDLLNAKKFLAKAPKTVTVQSVEFILTGILRQETDFNKYKLTY